MHMTTFAKNQKLFSIIGNGCRIISGAEFLEELWYLTFANSMLSLETINRLTGYLSLSYLTSPPPCIHMQYFAFTMLALYCTAVLAKFEFSQKSSPVIQSSSLVDCLYIPETRLTKAKA